MRFVKNIAISTIVAAVCRGPDTFSEISVAIRSILSAASAGCAAPLVSMSLKCWFHAMSISRGLFRLSVMAISFRVALLRKKIFLRGIDASAFVAKDDLDFERLFARCDFARRFALAIAR